MKRPAAWFLVVTLAVVVASGLIGLSSIALLNGRPREPVATSIAAALLERNARYKFNDGVNRRGWSTIHSLDMETALAVDVALHRAADRTGIPVNYLAAYVAQESTGDPRAEYRNPAQWDAAGDDRGRFAATDLGLAQISGRNLIARFPRLTLAEMRAKAEDINFATAYLADQVASDLKWASLQKIDPRDGVSPSVATRAGNPYWLAILAYNRGRKGAMAALSNPRACRHAELVIDAWARIDAVTGLAPTAAIRAPTFPALPADDRRRIATGDILPNVEALQRLLNDRLNPSPGLIPDSNFGPATRDALIRFQRSHDLEPTGATDARTWAALLGSVTSDASEDAQPFILGSVGPNVEALQRLLNDRLAPSPALKPDGNFGPATRDALIRFQRSRGIAPTGAVDARTWEVLNSHPGHDPGIDHGPRQE